MNRYLRKYFVFSTLLVCGCLSSGLKCPYIFIDIEGYVDGDSRDRHSVFVEIMPKTHPYLRDVKYEFSGAVADDGYFQVEAYFQTLRSASRVSHDCSRRPEAVRLTLYQNGAAGRSEELSFDTQFIEYKAGHYKLKSPVMFSASR